MDKFPIMEMTEGDAVTVTHEWGTARGTVNWWHCYEGVWCVSVKLGDGNSRVFESSGPRAAKFWR